MKRTHIILLFVIASMGCTVKTESALCTTEVDLKGFTPTQILEQFEAIAKISNLLFAGYNRIFRSGAEVTIADISTKDGLVVGLTNNSETENMYFVSLYGADPNLTEQVVVALEKIWELDIKRCVR